MQQAIDEDASTNCLIRVRLVRGKRWFRDSLMPSGWCETAKPATRPGDPVRQQRGSNAREANPTAKLQASIGTLPFCEGRMLDWGSSGRGAAWLARLLGVQEVPGSNPGGPTKTFQRVADTRSSTHPSVESNLESTNGRQRGGFRRATRDPPQVLPCVSKYSQYSKLAAGPHPPLQAQRLSPPLETRHSRHSSLKALIAMG